MTTASFNGSAPGARMNAAFELWKFDSLADPAKQRNARQAPAQPDPALALNAIREAAHAEGYAAGLAAGQAEGKRLAEQQASRLAGLVNAFEAALSRLQDEVGTAILGLSLDVAKQVLRSELAAHPEAILPGIRETLDLAGTSQQSQLLINPADVPLVREHLGDVLKAGQWHIIEDASIERGGCKVVTGNGSIDATLSTRWSRIAGALGSGDAW